MPLVCNLWSETAICDGRLGRSIIYYRGDGLRARIESSATAQIGSVGTRDGNIDCILESRNQLRGIKACEGCCIV